MSNLNAIYTANPLSTVADDDLIYVGDSLGAGSFQDGAIKKSDLLTQLLGEIRAGLDFTKVNGLKITRDSATQITIGTGHCYAENGDEIDVTSAIVKGSLSLSASTWYHVYVYLSGGSPAAEVVTTAPVAWKGIAYSKTGDTSRRYVFSILTDGSGNVKDFEHNVQDNHVAYKLFRSDTSPQRVLSGGTSATAAAVAMTGIIPVTAKLVSVRITNLSDKSLYTSEDNSVGSTQSTVALQRGDTAAQSAFMSHSLDGSQQLWYKMAAAVGTGAAYIDVLGYFFDR